MQPPLPYFPRLSHASNFFYNTRRHCPINSCKCEVKSVCLVINQSNNISFSNLFSIEYPEYSCPVRNDVILPLDMVPILNLLRSTISFFLQL